jgi:hypothetical protein
MTRLIRRTALLLAAFGLLPATGAFANLCPSCSTLPCAIVLVGHNGDGVADPYGRFPVILRDGYYSPLPNITVRVDFSGCCPDLKLSNTQHGVGVTHADGSATVTAVTDMTGAATFIIEGAASQGGGASTGARGTSGCATVSAMQYGGFWILITNGVDFPTVLVSTPDENGAAGTPGVEATDLSVFIADKNSYYVSTANYRQRSDFDFHLPAYNCSAVFNSSAGFGDNLGDLGQWVKIKNGGGSMYNGPFPLNCP